MQRIRMGRAGLLTLFATVALGGALVQSVSHPLATRAQSQQFTGTVVNICGTVSAFTPSTTSSPGSITFTQNTVNTTYGIPANFSFAGLGPSTVGQNLCLSGVLNGANQILSASVKQNVEQSSTICGVVVSYTPPTASAVGVLSIAGTTYPVALGAVVSASVTTGANVCVALTVNALGQITAGTAQNNTGTTTSMVPVEVCGTVTAFTNPTSSTAGSISFNAGGFSPTYTLPAGATVTGNGTIQVGQSLCFIGVIGANNTVTTTFLVATNFTTNFVQCGTLNAYGPGSSTTLGFITLNNNTIPIAYATQPTGDVLILQQGICITGTLNGLGQVATFSVQNVALPTSTVTPVATATGVPTATNTSVPLPPPPSPNTATPTSTPVPTATSTPIPTNTAVPAPRPTASFSSTGIKDRTIRIGTRETISAHAGFAGRQKVVVTVYFATGLEITFHGHTNSHGAWTASFTIPRDTISRYSNLAVVTFEVFKNHTTAKDFQTFRVVR